MLKARRRLAAGLAVAICAGLQAALWNPIAVRATSPPPGTISTFAGPNVANLALAIPQTPSGLAVFGATLYVSDSQAGLLYAVNTTTDVETLVASGLGAAAGLGVDSAGSVFVAEGNRVQKVIPSTGAVSTVAGGGAGCTEPCLATSATVYPLGVAVDSAGNLFIADTGNNKIREVDHATGNIATVAGTGAAGFNGDGITATLANLSSPADVWVDGSGNLWIADSFDYRIRYVDHTTHLITTKAGNGTATQHQCSYSSVTATSVALSDPQGIWEDGSGNVYFADLYNFCVQRLSGTTIDSFAGVGTTAQYAGDGGPATSAALVPMYVAGDGAGNVYISDQNLRVRKVSGGTITTVAGTGAGPSRVPICVSNGDGNQATLVPLCNPVGLAFDSSGNLYVGENGADAVRKITPAGVISTVAGNGLAANTLDGSQGDGLPATRAYVTPGNLAIAGNGDMYIAEPWPGVIRKIDHSSGIISRYAGCGCVQAFADGVAGLNASFLEMGGIALDAAGDLFVADGFTQRIRKIDTSPFHIVTTVAGGGFNSSDGIPATSAQLNQPVDVAVDSLGDILIADHGTPGRVRKVDPGGTITTLASMAPTSVTVGPGDRVVATTGNEVDVLSTFGPNRIAGTGAAGFSGDGGPATAAQLNNPVKVAFDSSANMYIADTYNGRIREVTAYTAPGAPTTVKASPAAHAAVVTWTAPANIGGTAGIAAYEVIPYRGSTPLTPIWVQGAPAATTATIQLAPGQSYTFTVTASNGWDTGPASAASLPVTPYLLGPPGDIVTAAGAVGNGPATSLGQFPYSLAANGSDLYIGDLANPVVRDLNVVTGQEGVLAGNDAYGYSGDGGPAAAARLNGAGAMAVCSGVTYIADTFNYVIRKIAGGTISTVAGTGTPGYSGDGGPATQAQIGRVFGLACRSNGGVYISDSDAGAVRILDGAGTISTWCRCFSFPTGIVELAINGTITVAVSDSGADNLVWLIFQQGGVVYGCLITGQPRNPFPYCGPGTANSVSLKDPRGLALLYGSTLLIADRGNNLVRTVDLSSETAGQLTGATFAQPTDVAVAGNAVYVADSGNYRVEQLIPSVTTVAGNGTPSWSGDGGWATSAQLGNPFAVAADQSGAEYVADAQNSVIRKIAGATITTVAGTPGQVGAGGDGGQATSAQLYYPEGVAVDGSGNLYISDTGNGRVRKVDLSGVISTLVAVPHPRGIAVDGAGTVYVADSDHNRVWRVSGSSLVPFAGTGVAGYSGDGHAASAAQLDGPWGVAVDSAGNVYIADTNNSVIRRVDHTTGDITTIAGDGKVGFGGDGKLAVNAQLARPLGVAVDGAGRVFVADTNNQRVRMVDGQGVILSEVGTCSVAAGFAGDGQPMALGQLNYPVGLAVDKTGDLLIADVDNNRVRAAVAPFVTRSAACPSQPGAPGARGVGSQTTPSSGTLRIPDRKGSRLAPVADQPIHMPLTTKPIPSQGAPVRSTTTTSKSAVTHSTASKNVAEQLRAGRTSSAQALSPAAAAVKTTGAIPIAGAVLPLLLMFFAVALMRSGRRKRKTR